MILIMIVMMKIAVTVMLASVSWFGARVATVRTTLVVFSRWMVGVCRTPVEVRS